MEDFYGIVIQQSLKDHKTADILDIVAHKMIGTWDFLFVRVREQQLHETIIELQANMIDVDLDCWYNHFFKNDALVVVYQDQVFQTTVDSQTWEDVVQYGLDHGIPIEQLDFNPRTLRDCCDFFEIKMT
ncbi:hypothetical protein EJP82_02875 [Paenibacillus anaericanus]|uniref:Uncharacterized protein n=1 Tax=Paenibacillus anaericanus TaxID=170367 RepID=A0A3S1DMV1_9BACL|nr:hypothetical protein [Paenibacillus anaericanus]RUT48100.1 hypothetical protein EJP82_02875 [Paenibacillus anaericanus]